MHYFKTKEEAAAFALDKRGKVIQGIYGYALVDKDEKTYLLELAYKNCYKYKFNFEWKNIVEYTLLADKEWGEIIMERKCIFSDFIKKI